MSVESTVPYEVTIRADHPPFGCTLLVSSCDAYADLWMPYFALLRMRWPDCPFPVQLITEELDPQLPAVTALCLGRGRDWSSLMLEALDQVATPYVLLTLEDFFLRDSVDTDRILLLLRIVQRSRLRMLRLIPRPGPTAAVSGVHEFGTVEAGAPYRVSTQAAIWEVATLRSLLVAGESAWEFERNGTARSGGVEGFAAVWREALPYGHHVVERGRWFPWEAWRYRRMNIGVDLSARPVMTTRQSIHWLLGKALHAAFRMLPVKVRGRIKSLVGRTPL